MTEFLNFLLESSLCLAGFVVVYRLFLRRMKHFGWNRAFLLSALLFSLALPALQWEVNMDWLGAGMILEEKAPEIRNTSPIVEGKMPVNARETLAMTEELAPEVGALQKVPAPSPIEDSGPDWRLVLLLVWILGAGLTLMRLVHRLYKLMQYRRLPAEGDVVALPAGGGSFSYAGRIYLDDAGLSQSERDMVIRHERAHLQQRHGWDNLLLETAGILWWFHPFFPVLRKSLRNVHEYQADAIAAGPDPLAYSRLGLKLAPGPTIRGRVTRPPATAFADSKAGQRIEMLHKKTEAKMSKTKYLLSLPLLALFAYAFVLVPAPKDADDSAARPAPPVEVGLTFAGEPVPVKVPHVHAKLEKELNRLKADQSLAPKLEQRARTWAPKVTAILSEQGIPMDFFYLAVAESNLRLNAKSPGGAGGMWQFLPATARTFGLTVNGSVDQRLDAELSTRAACRYLNKAYSELGSWTAAAVAFNRGVPGYRNYLSNRKVATYFEAKDQREYYLYRVIAYKLLMLSKSVPDPAGNAQPETNPPHAWPLDNNVEVEISSGFGTRNDPDAETRKMHNGIDLKAPLGTAVLAPSDGEVIEVGEDSTHGKHIILRHDDEYTTHYFHLSEINVAVGNEVKTGTQIGKVGSTGRSTGPHLHYEVRKNGEPRDPALYFTDPQGALPDKIDQHRNE